VSQTPSIDLSFLRSRQVQKRIAMVTVVFGVAGLLYGLLAPSWYRSTLTVVPAGQQKSGLSGLLGGQAGGLAAALVEGGGGGGADASRIAAVLQSTAVSDGVIDKFSLMERYGERYRELARKELWKHCDVKTLPKPNLVQLSCEDHDPAFVRDLLAHFAEFGNQVFRRVSSGSASEEARFLERRVAELRLQADDSAARMRAFQEKHKIVDLDTQAKAVVSSLAALHGQRVVKEVELGYARSFSSRDEAVTRQLESQIAAVNDRLRDLEEIGPPAAPPKGAGGGAGSRSTGLFPAAMAVPELRAEFEKLYRDRRVAEAILVFALERLENARANEARDVSTFQVLDPPTVPTRKSRPLVSESVGVAAALGFALSVLFEGARSRRTAAGA
jgi:capsule polysaccharide export protein KpsE/RkpR